MRKKVCKVESILLIAFLFAILAISFVSAADVAYIYNKNFKIDNNIKNLFSELNLTVDMVPEKDVLKTDFSNYKFIFVGDERFNSPKKLPIGKYPTVVTNYYHGYDWGLTDNDGISKLGRTEPMSVRINDSIIQVYTEGVYDSSSVAIPYYYLGTKDKASAMSKVAGTYSGNGHDLGDVISYSHSGTLLLNGKYSTGNICFFGIVSSEYWTDDAKQMFLDCLSFVGSECSTDSDCGEESTSEFYCVNSSVYQNTSEYYCTSPGTIEAKCNSHTTSHHIEDCEFGCSNGECLPECSSDSDCDDTNSRTEDICLYPGTKNSTCVHNPILCFNSSECGTDGFLGSLFCGDNSTIFQNYITFTCNNPGTAASTCSNSTSPQFKSTCLTNQVCRDGSCLNVICKTDSDCDDSNENTQDICKNPGTPESYCEHKTISCKKNLDCGTDGLFGPNFCIDNSVYQNYTSYTCNSPGTFDSECSSAYTPQLKQACLQNQKCQNGMCVNVNCNLDSDCGTSGFLNQPFCKSDNVFDKYITYKCNSPGTTGSYCSNSTEDRMVNDCFDKCYNNQCVNITCYNNNQCNDNNSNTEDTCINPGTPESYCDHSVIHCSKNTDCGQNGFSENYCFNQNSFEDFITYTCINPGTSQSYCSTSKKAIISEYCDFDCVSGECIGCFNDLSCGNPGYIGDKYCEGNKVYWDYQDFMCTNPGTGDSTCMSSISQKLITECKGLCFKGECKELTCSKDSDCDDNNVSTRDQCNNPGTGSSYCSHTKLNCVSSSDCGVTGFIGTEFCVGANVFKNFQNSTCMNPGTINSYCSVFVNSKLVNPCGDSYCDPWGQNVCKNGNVYHSRTCYNKGCATGKCVTSSYVEEESLEVCSYGCNNGVCNNVRCNSNSQCDDNNTYTEDICINPGTSSSSCQHNFITCSNNLQCGQNAYVGDLFCISNGVYQNFKTFTCNNPGTVNSYCSSSSNPQLKTNCAYGQTCSLGLCVNVVCNNDNDCNDNNPMTADTCVNPGTTSSYCAHNAISCNSNSGCGQNGFSGALFCQGSSVFQNFVTYTCSNPGTVQSSCSSSVIPQLKQTCAYGCNNGACNQNNCVDNDHDSYDICSPGTIGDDGKLPDCNDNNPNVHPNAVEVCNGIDDDCDSQIDEGSSICGSNQVCSSGNCLPVICNSNSDCGTSAFSGPLFCQNNNVFQNFVTYTCSNPGSAYSSCSSSVIPQLKQTCSYGCNNGVCNQNNCVDNDHDSYDTCSQGNPGDDGKQVDCNDNNPNVHPNAVEVCNGIDDDCDGQIDEGSSICGSNQVCSSGKCVLIKCNSNSECGQNGYLNQLSCSGSNVLDKYITFTCNNPGTANSFCSNSTTPQVKQVCSYGCTNGVCNQNNCVDYDHDSYDTCSQGNPGDDGKQVDCNDNNPNVHPNAVEVCNGIDDDCDGQIDEGSSICGNGKMCYNGNCLPITCSNDFDCDDLNTMTYDQCVNPGSVFSYCIHNPINCNLNSDCGQNKFLNQNFCKDGNVFDKYITYTCNSPGTPQSYCTNVVSEKTKTLCPSGQTCSNNQCTPINCYFDSDCNDGLSTTVDKCNFPGTVNSYCSHIPVKCNSNSECGQNGFIGGLLCQNDNVYQNYITYTCTNPGSANSKCTNSTIPQIKVDCDDTTQTCSNGSCVNRKIPCSSNSECGTNGYIGDKFCLNTDSYQNYIAFTCNLPGSVNSYCSNSTTAKIKQECDADTQICSNGVCSNGNIRCYSNSDCGTNKYLNQLFCKNDNVFDKYLTFTCNNPGTIGSTCSNSTSDKQKQACSYGCSSGACKQNTCVDNDFDTYDNCPPGNPGDDGKQVDCNDNNPNVHPNAVEVCNGIDDDCDGQIDEGSSICGSSQVCSSGNCIPIICSKDSDCGTSGAIGNLFCQNKNVFQNYLTYICSNPGTVQSSCAATVLPQLKKTCSDTQICSNGDCVSINIPCHNNSECDDSNSHTYDKCNNPGTVQSFCSHTPIVCLDNVDCGTDGFVDGLFCQNNNVFQNYLTYTCSNPGTTSSSCSLSSTPQQKKTCTAGQICQNGMCSNIICSSNSECGTDHDLNQPFCKDGNVYDKHIAFTCSNPGTSLSACSNSTSDILNTTCASGQVCSNGTCATIVCSKDSDCGASTFLGQTFCKDGNIFDKYLAYKCNNPGTAESFCSNSVEDKLKEACSSGNVCSTGVAFNPNNGETFTVGNNLDEIYNFVKSKDSSIGNCPLSGNGNAMLLAKVPWTTGSCSSFSKSQLDLTATKICNLAGYKDVNTYDSLYNADGGRCNYFSPADDCLWYWTGSSWQYSNSNNGANKFGERWITKLTCINRLPGPTDTGVTEPQCKKIICSKDSDCNDNNAGTKDKCNNPGTVNSYCSNTQCPTSGQNGNYPAPGQCNGADWNLGLPGGVTCTGSVTIDYLPADSKAVAILGGTADNRVKPDLLSMNQFCKEYTGQSTSYATYGRMHNYCTGCDQRIAWYTGSQWISQTACAGTLNVQKVTCATGCTASC